MVKMTLKQQRFADEYIISGNATEAAILAGYSEKTAAEMGHENLRKPNIKAYVEKRLDELRSEKVADQQEILETLTAILRGTKKGTALVGVGMGEQTVEEVKPTVQEKIRAAELLGKRYAMWTDKQDITQRNIEITVGEYDDDDHA